MFKGGEETKELGEVRDLEGDGGGGEEGKLAGGVREGEGGGRHATEPGDGGRGGAVDGLEEGSPLRKVNTSEEGEDLDEVAREVA